MTLQMVLDLGSHSAKLYRSSGTVEKVGTRTWQLLEHSSAAIRPAIEELVAPWLVAGAKITAVGTEAMRRSSYLESQVSQVCKDLAISYRTLSHSEEARLIALAFQDAEGVAGLDLLNAGGGSIQLVSPLGSTTRLLRFGISDLNVQFQLRSEVPTERKTEAAISWIMGELPVLGEFSYTGGEATYLRKMGVPMAASFCQASNFEEMAKKLASMPNSVIKAMSPYDPDWMTGAIASNCIVIAALRKAAANRFHASDFNIAHGLLRAL